MAPVTTSVLVTSSKALVTSSDALVSNSFLLLLAWHLLLHQILPNLFGCSPVWEGQIILTISHMLNLKLFFRPPLQKLSYFNNPLLIQVRLSVGMQVTSQPFQYGFRSKVQLNRLGPIQLQLCLDIGYASIVIAL